MLQLKQYISFYVTAYEDHCMSEKLAGFYFDTLEYNANALFHPPKKDEHPFLPYVGNGVFGIPIENESWLYIKNGKTLSLQVRWQPLIMYKKAESAIYKEATITHYMKGIVYKYQCFRDGFHIGYQYYAHREHQGIFVQEIKITNPMSVSQEFPFQSQVSISWTDSHTEQIG